MTAEIAAQPVQPLEQHNLAHFDTYRPPETTDTGTTWRQRLGQVAGRAALALGLAAGGSAGLASEATPALAAGVTCYGDYCSGQYADDTGCDQDAYTLDSKEITGVEYRWNSGLSKNDVGFESHDVELSLGTIELRYSPTCKTKWARMRTIHDSDISDVSVTQDTGYKQSRHVGGFWKGIPAAVATSPMIYSPDNAVHAYVEGGNLIQLSTDWK